MYAAHTSPAFPLSRVSLKRAAFLCMMKMAHGLEAEKRCSKSIYFL